MFDFSKIFYQICSHKRINFLLMNDSSKYLGKYEKLHLVEDTRPNLHLFFEISKEYSFHRFDCYITDNQFPKAPEIFRIYYRIADENLIDDTCAKIWKIVSTLFPDHFWRHELSSTIR